MRFPEALLLVLGASLVWSGVGHASPAPSVRVERTGAARMAVVAGTVSTVAFRVRNLDNARAIAGISVVLPEGWTLINAADEVILAASAADVQLLSFAVPKTARPGTYSVRYSARSGSGIGSTDSILIDLQSRAELDVQFLSAPALIRSGTHFVATFMLRNRGNVPIQASLRADVNGGLTARPDFTSATIIPGGSFHVNVRVAAPANAKSEVHARVRLTAKDLAQDIEVNTTSTLVRVLPDGTRSAGTGGTFPLQLFARVNSADQTTPGLELSGSGLAVAGTDLRLEVVARTPSRMAGLMDQRERYYARLSNRNFDLRLGDHVAALTPLTEVGRLGFGASMALNAGPFILGALALNDRHFQQGAVFGGRAGVRLGSIGSLTGNYLQKADERRVFSVRALLAPARFLHGDVELARNLDDAAADARSINVGGSLQWLSYDVRSVRNAADYHGPYAGASSDAANVRVRPIPFLELGGSLLRSEQTSSFFPIGGRAESMRAFASLGRVLTLEGEQRDWTRSSDSAGTHTQVLRARTTLKTGFVTWYPGIENIRKLDRVTGDETEDIKYSMRMRMSIGQQRLSASFGGVAAERTRDAWTSNSASALLKPWRSTAISFDYQHDQYNSGWQTTLLTGSIDQELPRGHHIAARTRFVIFNGQTVRDQSTVTLEYMMPLNVRVPRSTVSRVEGILFDAETQRPIANAQVRLDDKAVITGSNGRFSFRNVSAGTHYVQVDLAAAGANLTTTTQNPLVLDLTNAGSKQLRIPVTRAARVRGSVTAHAIEQSDSARIRAFRESTIVELSQGSDSHRRSLDASGRFSFEGLRPGTWRLRVVNDLPLDYGIADGAAQTFDLTPGDEQDVVLQIVRRQRPMKLQPEQELKTLQKK